MASKKKGPISSREAGEDKPPVGGKADASAPTEPPEPPAEGETVTVQTADPNAPKAQSDADKATVDAAIKAASKPLAPSAEVDSAQARHKKRRAKKSAHGSVVGRKTMDRGDLSKVPETVSFRIQKDKQVAIEQRPVLLRAGQIVTNLTHDLDLLRRQGAVLEPVR